MTTQKQKLVDPKVHDLAAAFLKHVKGARGEDVQELAEEIQETIEDFISAMLEVEDEA